MDRVKHNTYKNYIKLCTQHVNAFTDITHTQPSSMKRPVAMPRWLTCWTSRSPPRHRVAEWFLVSRREGEGGFSPTYSMKLGTPDKVIAKIWIKHYKMLSLIYYFFLFRYDCRRYLREIEKKRDQSMPT